MPCSTRKLAAVRGTSTAKLMVFTLTDHHLEIASPYIDYCPVTVTLVTTVFNYYMVGT